MDMTVTVFFWNKEPFLKIHSVGEAIRTGKKKDTLWVASKKSHAEVGLARWQSQATVSWHLKNFGLTSAKRA